MKKLIIISLITALFASGTALRAQDKQDYLGLPGDNLNLFAVMKLFQESKTLEEFERNLNDPENNINNLDLNNDNRVDYIKVIDNIDGDVHNIVLQVAVSPRENQDVAVFTVQRFNNGQVEIQLTGDEELYGKNYIIEPITDDANSTPNPGYTGQYVRTTPAEIAVWPVVRFIYLPTYTGWHSSWYWGYYPNYWHPWRPVSWHFYYGYHSNWYNVYYSHYRPWSYHRYSRWNDYYYVGHRTYSPEVYHRVESGTFKSTYSHPDQRRKGEKMFEKRHPDEYRSVHSTGNNSAGRSDPPSDRNIFTDTHNGRSTSTPRTTITRPERHDNSGRSNNNHNNSSVTNTTRDNNSGRENNSGNVKSNESNRRSVNRSQSAPVVKETQVRTESGSSVRQSTRKSNQTGTPSVNNSRKETRRESKSVNSSKKEKTRSDSDNKDHDRR